MEHKFQIKSDWTKNGQETRVYLDDECIYLVDKTLYAGKFRKNCEPEIRKTLSKILGREITSKELSTARILETISD